MSNISDLHITVRNINNMLGDLGRDERVRATKAYGKHQLVIDMPNGGIRDTKPRGAKDCLMYAEGMEKALELIWH